MKKFISVILAVIMIFGITSVAAYATGPETYEIIFTEQEFAFGEKYDLYNYRSDYVGKYMGYEYGVDYWYTINNWNGTTTDVKGLPYSIDVYEGDPLEITVSVADYVDPASVRMLAFPTATSQNNPESLYNDVTGEPDSSSHITRNAAGRYGLRPTQNMTVCLSEWHLRNDAFLCKFPQSTYYSTERVHYNDKGADFSEQYVHAEWGNTTVIYVNETLFFEVRLPLDDTSHKYHLDSYQVYYTSVKDNKTVTTYLKTADQTDMSMSENWVAHYIVEPLTDDDILDGVKYEQVDVFAIPNVDPSIQIKVAGTVTYTMAMLREFFQDFDITNMDNFDWDSVDFAPMVEYISRILALIMKILAGFGLSLNF